MPAPKKRFTLEFCAKAVRLTQTSGRIRWEVAEDLGIELSTSRHWIDRQHVRETEVPLFERQKGMATEVKRLRWENEVLR